METDNSVLFETIFGLAQKSGMVKDVPLLADPKDEGSIIVTDEAPTNLTPEAQSDWVRKLQDYLVILQDRLFSSGLHVFGSTPTDEELLSYLEAYFGDRLSKEDCHRVISKFHEIRTRSGFKVAVDGLTTFVKSLLGTEDDGLDHAHAEDEALQIVRLLDRSTEELDSVLSGLTGGYIRPGNGGDLLRDGVSVLPTGRNIHALDPYRMPSAGAWARGQKAAEEIIRQHKEKNNGQFPETVAMTLWGLDAIKTRYVRAFNKNCPSCIPYPT